MSIISMLIFVFLLLVPSSTQRLPPSVDPCDDNVFATACNDGGAFIFDSRGANENQWDACVTLRSSSPFHAVMHNPVEPRLLATANTKDGVGLWDIRSPKEPIIRFTDCLSNMQSAMSVRFNIRGTQILSLGRRQPPVLYNLTSPLPVAEFDHITYYNSCTMKSCCFAGANDEYVLSGSDDFKLYAWRIPQSVINSELSRPEQCEGVDEAHLVLLSHRSIVNQVRFNYSNSLIASSGVEKIIKLWNTFPLPNGSGSLDPCPLKQNRKVYSHEDYINLVLESGQHMTHDYSHQSVQEDPRMMAFFDSLVQRDIEGWTSESDSDSLDGHFNRNRYTNMKSSSSTSGDEDEHDDCMKVLSPHSLAYFKMLNERVKGKKKPLPSKNIQMLVKRSPSMPSVSGSPAPGSDACASTSRLDSKVPLTTVSIDPDDIASDVNKISQLIHEKKREQLRKVARFAVRTTRKRLKKIHKYCMPVGEDLPQSSMAAERAARYQAMSELTQQLNESVDADAKTCAEENNVRRSKYKVRRRLRYLTNQSDYILNDAYPRRTSEDSDDSSDSESSDGPIDRNSLWRTMRGSIRIVGDDDEDDDEEGVEEAIDTCESSSGTSAEFFESDSDTDAEHGKPVITNDSQTHDADGTSSSTSFDKQVQADSHHRPHPVIVDQLLLDEESKSQSEAIASTSTSTCTLQSGPVVKRFRCVCEGASSANSDCHCCELEVVTQSDAEAVVFKTVNHRNRSYRKRKMPDDPPASPAC